ncbi:MAG TPA: hypothetical protein VEV41_18715 [Terriglobales bacterium]|nr:hypothetical protein [Terriglobales bacterium]
MKQFSKFAGTVTVLLSLACAALAQQGGVHREGGNWAQESSGSMPAARNLRIKVDFGTVHVQGGSQQDINYVFRNVAFTSSEDKARRQLEAYKVSTYVRGDTAYIVAEIQGGRPTRCSGEFTVNVPRATEAVNIETDGGNVVVNGIAGRLEAETGGGSIKVDDIGGSVKAETGGDYIDVGTVGGDVNLQTGGGRISIRSVKGKINASTGGGDMVILSGSQGAVLEAGGGNIQVKQCVGKVRVSTGGGNIDLGDIGGPVEMETGGGSIRLASAKGPVRAETGAGRIELNGVPSARAETGAGGVLARLLPGGERADSTLETSAGDITVYIASGVAVTVRAAIELANGHQIQSDFPEIRVTREGDWPGTGTASAEGSLNGGGPTLKLRTTTGDIRILRAH